MAGGEPFYFPGGPAGCLLVHGFTGAPEEMRWMGEYLAERGFSVLGVRLFGHATDPADMNRSRWEDWLASVEDGYHLLLGQCSQVVTMGLSLGGALALLAAAALPMAGVVVMDTPAWVPDRRVRRLRPLLPLLSAIIPFIGQRSSANPQIEPDTHLHYSVLPLRATGELHDVLKVMRARLHSVQAPALLMYAAGNHAIGRRHAQLVLEGLGTTDKSLEWIERSGHVIPRSAGRQAAFELAERFVSRVTAS